MRNENNLFITQYGEGAGHYSIAYTKQDRGMEAIRTIFPDGKPDEMNFILFSTSGVHGTYNTIEDVEAYLNLSEEDRNREDCELFGGLTYVIIQPRLCALKYGNCEPQNKEDIDFLKSLRYLSRSVVQEIG